MHTERKRALRLAIRLANLGYDWLLSCRLSPKISVICYADDTLVTTRGVNYDEAARLNEVGIHRVINCIEALGLKISSCKTLHYCSVAHVRDHLVGLPYAFEGKR